MDEQGKFVHLILPFVDDHNPILIKGRRGL